MRIPRCASSRCLTACLAHNSCCFCLGTQRLLARKCRVTTQFVHIDSRRGRPSGEQAMLLACEWRNFRSTEEDLPLTFEECTVVINGRIFSH